jgi:hypothetical protein
MEIPELELQKNGLWPERNPSMRSHKLAGAVSTLLLVWMAIVFQEPLAASLLINYTATNPNTTCAMNGVAGAINGSNISGALQSSQGPLIGSLSCAGPNNFSIGGTATANYGEVEVGILMTGIGIFEVEPIESDTITFTSTDLPAGTPIEVTVPFFETGGYSYSDGSALTVNAVVFASLAGNTIVNDCYGCMSTSGSGSVDLNRNFSGTPLNLEVGPVYTFTLAFTVTLDNGSSAGMINFGDPSIPYFQITDPSTGALISDVGIQSGSGTVYAVNSSVPEPPSLMLVGLGLLGSALAIRSRGSRKSKTPSHS